MAIKNQRLFFLRSVLTLALLTGGANVQALTGTTSVQSLVMLVGMAATQTTDENFEVDFDSLGISLAELFNLEVSIATGVKQSVAKAPSVASVITAKDIEAIGATDIDEILETIPGLHVAKQGFNYDPIFSIRGIYSNVNPEVLVMINGISIKNLFEGNRSWAWGGMPVNAIARIEVIRGPGSAVYGADAFSGVINIITKTKEDIDGTEVGARIGSFNTHEVWALHGDNWGSFDIALVLEYHETDGQRKIIEHDAQTNFDQVFNTDASLAPGPVNLSHRNLDARLDISKNNWQLRAGYQGRHDLGGGAGGGLALDPYMRHSDDRFNADLTYHNPTLT
jgi:iron complex outermembrane receptor protein